MARNERPFHIAEHDGVPYDGVPCDAVPYDGGRRRHDVATGSAPPRAPLETMGCMA
jgi:hypothetical protein